MEVLFIYIDIDIDIDIQYIDAYGYVMKLSARLREAINTERSELVNATYNRPIAIL